MRGKSASYLNLWLLLTVAVFLLVCPAHLKARGQEMEMSNDDFKQLDEFEAHNLSKADKIYNAKKYTQALAEYEAFLTEYPTSKAVPYALLRKARCLQLDDKRYNAIKIYNELMDFFPNNVPYAAASLYFMGQCHQQNGEPANAVKAWAELADDKDYSKMPIAATALDALAKWCLENNKAADAARYAAQAAIDFRGSNPNAAREAMIKVINYHIRTKVDEKALRQFYIDVKTFEHNPGTPAADLDKDTLYWTRLMQNVDRLGSFNELQKDLRQKYYGYWADQMQGHFPQWDDFQIALAKYRLQVNESHDEWKSRLDKQFADFQKEGDYGRIVKWMRLYAGNKKDALEYYGKLSFDKMSNEQLAEVMWVCFDVLKDDDMARNTFSKLKLGPEKTTDAYRHQLGRALWSREFELFKQVCQTWDKQEAGKMELLRHMHWQYLNWHKAEPYKEGLVLATELVNVPDYSKEAWRLKAQMLQHGKKYEEAIAAFNSADSPPGTNFEIAQCQVALGKLTLAVGALREVENFFGDRAKFGEVASQASLTIAHYYREAGLKDKYVAELRGVLKKYPASSHSSQAHQELEQLGLKIGGGLDESEK